jgi:hypothetical protein
MTKQQKTGLYIIAVLAFARFAVVPWLEWVDTRISMIQALNQNKERFQNVQSKISQLGDQQQLIFEGYQTLSAMWHEGAGAQASVKIMQHIERTAKKHSIELSTRQAGQPVIVDGVSSIPLSLFIKGMPQNVFAFLVALESSKPLAVIQTARLTKANVASQDMTATLELAVLLKPEQAMSAEKGVSLANPQAAEQTQ